MGLNLKDIGKKLATNPFLNPLGAMANQNKTQKELDALKASQSNQYAPDFSQYVPSATPQETATSTQLPTWAIITISLAGVGAVVGIGVLIYKAVKK